MNNQLLKLAGQAMFGNQWKAPTADLLNVNERTIKRYAADELTASDRILSELAAALGVRGVEIENVRQAILNKTLPANAESSHSASVYAVSDNGHLLADVFETQQQAQAFIDSHDEDDQYLMSVYEMSADEYAAIAVIDGFLTDSHSKAKLLKDIRAEIDDTPAQQVFSAIAQLDGAQGKEYFDYFVRKNYGINDLSVDLDGEGANFNERPTMTYKQFIIKKIAALTDLAASL